MAEFNWWLLLLGLAAGAVLAWLVLADSDRRDAEVGDEEIAAEAGWIARTLADGPTSLDAERAEAVLRAHRRYLAFPPPDALVDPDELVPFEPPVQGPPPGNPPVRGTAAGPEGSA